MKLEPGQIWVKNYAGDFHYLPVKVKIVSVDEEKIESEVIFSSMENIRPVGSILIAYLNGEDPFEYKKFYGWELELIN